MRILLDSNSNDPNYLQIENAIRSAICQGQLRPAGTAAFNPPAGETAAGGDHHRETGSMMIWNKRA